MRSLNKFLVHKQYVDNKKQKDAAGLPLQCYRIYINSNLCLVAMVFIKYLDLVWVCRVGIYCFVNCPEKSLKKYINLPKVNRLFVEKCKTSPVWNKLKFMYWTLFELDSAQTYL